MIHYFVISDNGRGLRRVIGARPNFDGFYFFFSIQIIANQSKFPDHNYDRLATTVGRIIANGAIAFPAIISATIESNYFLLAFFEKFEIIAESISLCGNLEGKKNRFYIENFYLFIFSLY